MDQDAVMGRRPDGDIPRPLEWIRLWRAGIAPHRGVQQVARADSESTSTAKPSGPRLKEERGDLLRSADPDHRVVLEQRAIRDRANNAGSDLRLNSFASLRGEGGLFGGLRVWQWKAGLFPNFEIREAGFRAQPEFAS